MLARTVSFDNDKPDATISCTASRTRSALLPLRATNAATASAGNRLWHALRCHLEHGSVTDAMGFRRQILVEPSRDRRNLRSIMIHNTGETPAHIDVA